MDAEFTKKAREAAKRTNIDKMVAVRSLLRKAKVNPFAMDLSSDEADVMDRIVLRVPDLLTLAVYAWYKLQEETAP